MLTPSYTIIEKANALPTTRPPEGPGAPDVPIKSPPSHSLLSPPIPLDAPGSLCLPVIIGSHLVKPIHCPPQGGPICDPGSCTPPVRPNDFAGTGIGSHGVPVSNDGMA